MLDKLTGKKELEERLLSLEALMGELKSEKESLAAKLASREETARGAVARKQVVEEKLNAAEKKIESLEHQIALLRRTAAKEVTFRDVTSISRNALNKYVFQIGSIRSMEKSLVTVYLRPGSSLKGHTGEFQMGGETAGLIDKIHSPTGIVIFYDTIHMVQEVIAPFLPIEVTSWKLEDRFDTGPLQELLEKEITLCVIIFHAGESFIGITSSPESFQDHQIIRSNVKSKHTKGGWSQRRFERLRDEDVQHHVEKVRHAVRAMIDGSDIDLIIASGGTKVVPEILRDLDYPVVEKSFDISVDKRNVDKILKDVWSSKRYEI